MLEVRIATAIPEAGALGGSEEDLTAGILRRLSAGGSLFWQQKSQRIAEVAIKGE